MTFRLLFFLGITLSTYFGVVAQSDRATKLILQNETIVEIVPEDTAADSDFVKINIKIDGRILKSFTTTDLVFPQVIGAFHSIAWNRGENSDVEYVLYRTSMGNGACAGGTLYVIAFLQDNTTFKFNQVHVSPALTTCLGEYPAFSFAYLKQGAVLDIAGHTLNLEKFDKWVSKTKAVKPKTNSRRQK